MPYPSLPATLPPQALEILVSEMTSFNRRLEELVDRARTGRSEDRKETWVLLSALALVVMLCFVAFYLNHSEVREMHSGLQDEIERAGGSAVSSVERTLAAFHLDRLPESQAAMDRFLKDKDRRDGERFTDLLAEIQKHSTQSGARLQNEIEGIQEELAILRRIAEDIRSLQPESAAVTALGPLSASSLVHVALSNGTSAGWAARAPDGPPNSPPDPAAGQPSPAAILPSAILPTALVPTGGTPPPVGAAP